MDQLCSRSKNEINSLYRYLSHTFLYSIWSVF